MKEPEFSVEHLGLASRDPVALANWYVRILDGALELTTDTTPPACFVRLPGGFLLEIYAGERGLPDTAQNRLHGWRHLALRVRSIEAARRVLEARGVVITEEVKPAGGGGRVLFFTDLEGNLLHLVERPTGGSFQP